MGESAGSNVAAPTFRTTNDVPIGQPDSFRFVYRPAAASASRERAPLRMLVIP